MKSFYLLPIILLLLTFMGNCTAQISRKNLVSYYKFGFINICTEQFENDTVWRDEICPWYPDRLDKKTYLEIDSMCALVREVIWNEIDEITGLPRDDSGPFPGRDCVLKHCLDQYESKDLDKLAKRFAKRMKNVTPGNFRLY